MPARPQGDASETSRHFRFCSNRPPGPRHESRKSRNLSPTCQRAVRVGPWRLRVATGWYNPRMDGISVEEVKRRIERALPGAQVRVGTFSGHDHFEALVEAPQFKNKTLVEQHQMVYAALDGLIGDAMHALALKTRPIEETP